MRAARYSALRSSRKPVSSRAWECVSLLIAAVQLVYAIYLAQLPDWSSVWVVAILSLIVTTLYATLMGAVVFGDSDSLLVRTLELSEPVRRKATLWCVSMVSICALLTYFCGRIGVRWRRAFGIAATRPAE